MVTDKSAPTTGNDGVPDIGLLPTHPIIQTLVSGESWVRVVFYGKQPPTISELDRTIELLCMMRNGWS